MEQLIRVRLDRRGRALLALVAVIVVVGPILALLRGLIPLPLEALILVGAWLAAYLASERILQHMIEGALRVLEEPGAPLLGGGAEGEAPDPLDGALIADPGPLGEAGGSGGGGPLDEYPSDEGDLSEAALLAWGFLTSLVEEVTGRRSSVYVAVQDDGVVYYVYPESYGEEVYKASEEDIEGDIVVAKTGDRGFLIILEEDILESLYDMASEGSGEALIVATYDDVELLYRIAREIAKSYLETAPKEYLDYVAYKALVKLKLRGALEAPQHLIDSLLDSDGETRLRIKKQVDEELKSLKPGSTGATPH